MLIFIHIKTGSFSDGIRAGAILAGAREEELAALTLYAEKFGLAFQITDDLLDITGEQTVLGKPIGSDAKNAKLTYPALYGFEQAKILAKATIEEAVQALAELPGRTEPLQLLVRYLEKRVS